MKWDDDPLLGWVNGLSLTFCLIPYSLLLSSSVDGGKKEAEPIRSSSSLRVKVKSAGLAGALIRFFFFLFVHFFTSDEVEEEGGEEGGRCEMKPPPLCWSPLLILSSKVLNNELSLSPPLRNEMESGSFFCWGAIDIDILGAAICMPNWALRRDSHTKRKKKLLPCSLLRWAINVFLFCFSLLVLRRNEMEGGGGDVGRSSG